MSRRTQFILGAVVLSSYLLLFFKTGVVYQPDSYTYKGTALELIRNFDFADSKHTPEVIRTPGYPILIGLFHLIGLGDTGVILFQILLVVVSTLLLSQFAFRVFSNVKLAITCGLLFAFNPIVLEHTVCLLTDIPFCFGTLILFILIYQYNLDSKNLSIGKACLLGILTGALILVRPAGMFLTYALIGYFFLQNKKAAIRFSIVFFVIASLLPFGWSLRNFKRTGIFAVSVIPTINLFRYSAAGVLAFEEPRKFNDVFFANQEKLQSETDEALSKEYSLPLDSIPLKARINYYDTVSKKILLNHKTTYFILCLRSLSLTLLAGSVDFLSGLTTVPVSLMRWLIFAYTVPGLILLLYGFKKIFKRNRSLFWISFIFVSYYTLISASSPGAGARFRLPFVSISSLMIAYGLFEILALARRAQNRTRVTLNPR